MKTSDVLSPAEEEVMKMAFEAAMNRAADVIDAITNEDVSLAQVVLFHDGMTVGAVAKIDRATLGAAHLRACALNLNPRDAAVINKLLRTRGI